MCNLKLCLHHLSASYKRFNVSGIVTSRKTKKKNCSKRLLTSCVFTSEIYGMGETDILIEIRERGMLDQRVILYITTN